jgi:excisionase family DNA binding protein
MLTPATAEAEFLTVPEVARLLRCSKPTVYRRITDGEIPAVKLGTTQFAPLRIRRDELEAWLRPVQSKDLDVVSESDGSLSRQGQLRSDAADPADQRRGIPDVHGQSSPQAHAGQRGEP